MKNKGKRKKIRLVLKWVGWVLLAQFVLINISAAFYAHKFTHLYPPDSRVKPGQSASKNVFVKTWRLFAGPRYYKTLSVEKPSFPYDTIVLRSKGNTLINAWYGRVDSVSRGTVILFHGLMQNRATILQQAYEFRYWGYNVMLVQMRDHGNSIVSTTTVGYRESEEVKLAYDYVKNLGEKSIFLWGISMGAVAVIKAVGEEGLKPAGLLLEMPFGSLQSHIKGRVKDIGFPKQPFGFFITLWIGIERGFNSFSFHTSRYAKEIDCPVLLQYGSEDQLVTQEEIDEIYDAFRSSDKRKLAYKGARHELFLQKDSALWRKEVGNFLNRLH